MEDQQLVQNFLREFSEKLAEKFSGDLDFILLEIFFICQRDELVRDFAGWQT